MTDRPAKSDLIDPTIALELLTKIEEDSGITQRSLASELGIALGLANTYLKRCVKKGLVKIQQVPANRYAYFLTPQGFAEKSRLTSAYLSQGLQFFRMARKDLDAVLKDCKANNFSHIALHGLTDLAEIAVLCSNEAAVKVVGIVDADTHVARYVGIPIVTDTAGLAHHNAIVLTDMGDPQGAYDKLVQTAHVPVLVPNLLKVRQGSEGTV